MKIKLKFRAWHKDAKLFVRLIYFTEDKALIQFGNKERIVSLTDLEIMQFTGLTDRNGVEIYFGDIVEYETTEGTRHKNEVNYSDELMLALLKNISLKSARY